MPSRNSPSGSPLSWLGLGKQASRPGTPRMIRLEKLGRGNAGKTALEWGMSLALVSNFLPSGLQLDMPDPLQMAEKLQQNRAIRRRVEHDALLPTLESKPTTYMLYQGEKKRLLLQSHEVMGQILTSTTPGSPPEWQQRYREYVQRLGEADVLLALVPSPPSGAGGVEMQRLHDDLKVTASYLRAALDNRSESQPCAVAVVLTKIDTTFRTAEEARQRLSEEVLRRALAPLVNLVTMADLISFAAIVPVSSFGFGNAVRKSDSSGPEVLGGPARQVPRSLVGPRGQDDERDSQESQAPGQADLAEPDEAVWTVRRGALVRPFNVDTLLVWSLLHGLRVQAVDPDDRQTALLVEVGRKLKQDLESLDGWVVPLKGHGAQDLA